MCLQEGILTLSCSGLSGRAKYHKYRLNTNTNQGCLHTGKDQQGSLGTSHSGMFSVVSKQ